MTRALRLPAVPRAWGNPDAIVLRAVDDARQGCARVGGDVRCVSGREVAPEEDAGFSRSLDLHRAAAYAMRMEVGLRPGGALARRVFRDQPVSVVASSTGTPDARGSVLAAVDGDARTTWTAGLDDTRPALALNWIDQRTITRLQVATDADTAAREPRRGDADLARRLAYRESRPRRSGAVPGDPYDAAHGAGRRRRAGEQPRVRLRSLVRCLSGSRSSGSMGCPTSRSPCPAPPPLPLRRRAVAGGRRRARADRRGGKPRRSVRRRHRASHPLRRRPRVPGVRHEPGGSPRLRPVPACGGRAHGRPATGCCATHPRRHPQRRRPPHAGPARRGWRGGAAREHQPGLGGPAGWPDPGPGGGRRMAARLASAGVHTSGARGLPARRHLPDRSRGWLGVPTGTAHGRGHAAAAALARQPRARASRP